MMKRAGETRKRDRRGCVTRSWRSAIAQRDGLTLSRRSVTDGNSARVYAHKRSWRSAIASRDAIACREVSRRRNEPTWKCADARQVLGVSEMGICGGGGRVLRKFPRRDAVGSNKGSGCAREARSGGGALELAEIR